MECLPWTARLSWAILLRPLRGERQRTRQQTALADSVATLLGAEGAAVWTASPVGPETGFGVDVFGVGLEGHGRSCGMRSLDRRRRRRRRVQRRRGRPVRSRSQGTGRVVSDCAKRSPKRDLSAGWKPFPGLRSETRGTRLRSVRASYVSESRSPPHRRRAVCGDTGLGAPIFVLDGKSLQDEKPLAKRGFSLMNYLYAAGGVIWTISPRRRGRIRAGDCG